eukprot:Skav205306  [mRNA]  locus=scaffold3444:43738:47628:+ [translate_table: standard]
MKMPGRIGVSQTRTSAELLRVLREFVRLRRSSGTRSEPTLARALSPAAEKSAETPSALRQLEATVVALLHYNDGLSRQMMLAEAVSQTLNRKEAESEIARMAAVPKTLNNFLRFVLDEGDGTLWLANASKLSCRFLPRGANEDGSLEVKEPEVLFFEEEDFEEEMRETESVIEHLSQHFVNTLSCHWKCTSSEFFCAFPHHLLNASRYLKKRFGGDPGVAKGGSGVKGIEVSASDQLSGVRVPSNLVNFYEEEPSKLLEAQLNF